MIRVLIVDDHAVVRQGLRQLLEAQTNLNVVGDAGDGETAILLAQTLKPDVILLDLLMPGMDGVEVVQRLRALSITSAILILTSSLLEQRMKESMKAGIQGYLLKASRVTDIVEAIQRAAQGMTVLDPVAAQMLIQSSRHDDPLESLSTRERSVFDLMARGTPNSEIATTLQINEVTVRTHTANMLDKLSLRDRTQVIIYALKRGLIDVEDLP